MKLSHSKGLRRHFVLLTVFILCVATYAERVPTRPMPTREPAAAMESPSDKELEAAISDDLTESAAKPSPPANAGTSPAQAPQQFQSSTVSPVESEPLPTTVSPVLTEPTLTLAESFSAEKNPGQGTLTYKHLDQNEVIDLGTPSGQFGFGLVFRHATLPEEFLREYGKVDVIQFSFGTLPSKAQGRVPEFGTMAVFTKVKPKEWTSFPLITGVQRQSNQDFGLILFSSPKASVQRSDDEKLRDTYFSKSGQIRLMSSGPMKGLDVDAEGKKVSFKVQAMKVEIEAELSTPFNAQKHQLQGAVEIPVYWPESPAALNWMRKFAQKSLLASNVVSSPRAAASQPPETTPPAAKKPRKP